MAVFNRTVSTSVHASVRLVRRVFVNRSITRSTTAALSQHAVITYPLTRACSQATSVSLSVQPVVVHEYILAVTQPQTTILVPRPADTLPIDQVFLNPDAYAVVANSTTSEQVNADPRWRLIDSFGQPSGVGIAEANGQFVFRLTHETDFQSTVSVTTGKGVSMPPTVSDGEVGVGQLQDTQVMSGPYGLRDSAVHWKNVQFPATWGATPDEVVAKASVVGDNGTDDRYSIDVTFSNGQITISHTDAGIETVDYTNSLNAEPPAALKATREAPTDSLFHWMRIESDPGGTTFSVYASVDGQLWFLLVTSAMGADMQAAFVRSSLVFMMTSSGTNASGAWVIGSINVLATFARYPGLYVHTSREAGFSYNAGVWAQFGAPLDGFHEGYVYDPDNYRYLDPSGRPHYFSINALCYAKDNYNTVYAVDESHALLWISHDGGMTWISRVMPFNVADPEEPPNPAVDPAAPLSDILIFDLVSPHVGEVVVLQDTYDVTKAGIYRTTDEGLTWTRVLQPHTTNPAIAPDVFPAGGMRGSAGKLWWAQQTGETTQTLPADVPPEAVFPRRRIVWSGSLEWFVDIDTYPEEQPFLEIPPLDISQVETTLTNADGTTTTQVKTAAFVYIVSTTPGIWAPMIEGDHFWVSDPYPVSLALRPSEPTTTFTLFEYGFPWVDQNPDGPSEGGIVGSVGYNSPIQPVMFWQPPSVSDDDVAEYWAMTKDIVKRNDETRKFYNAWKKAWMEAWNAANPDPPPDQPPPRLPPLPPLPPELTLPSMGGYNGGFIRPRRLFDAEGEVEPMNSRQGIKISDAFGDLSWGPVIDALDHVTPHSPWRAASPVAYYLSEITPGGGKLHISNLEDVITSLGPEPGGSGDRKAGTALGGMLSVVVVDVEPADLELWQRLGTGGHLSVIQPAQAGGDPAQGEWTLVGGEPGEYFKDSTEAGPSPGPPSNPPLEVHFANHTLPTWDYQEVVPTPPTEIRMVPSFIPGGAVLPKGGIILAAQICWGSELMPIPDGWTLVEDTEVSLALHSDVFAGHLPFHSGAAYQHPYGFSLLNAEGTDWMYYYNPLTGQKLVPGFMREYFRGEIKYDVRPMCQRIISHPFSSNPYVVVPLPPNTEQYWILPIGVGQYDVWQPTESGPPPLTELTSVTWEFRRCNYDGSGMETLGSITLDATSMGVHSPTFQVRPFSDDLCLYTSYWAQGVWRAQSGIGVVPLWSTTGTQAIPWDAVALDTNTFISVSQVFSGNPAAASRPAQRRRGPR